MTNRVLYFTRNAWSLALALAACRVEEPTPFYDPRTGGESDAGGRDEHPDAGPDGMDGMDDPERPDDPGFLPEPECGVFNPDDVHLVGVAGHVGTKEPDWPSGIVPGLNERSPCPSTGWLIAPVVRPLDGEVLYVGGFHDGKAAVPARVVQQFIADIPAITEDPVIETTQCADTGISRVFPDSTGDGIIYNCHTGVCQTGPFNFAMFQPWIACSAAPFYDQSGAVVVEAASFGNTPASVYAVNGKGEYLVYHPDGFGGYGIWNRSGDTTVPAAFAGSSDLGSSTVTMRGHAEGFWVVLQPSLGEKDRSLYLFHRDGEVEHVGTYPDPPSWGWSWALDASGDLYEELGEVVIRSTLDGEQETVYQPPARTTEQGRSLLHGGVSAQLITGSF